MNILNNLMTGKEFVGEVKGNMIMFIEYLDEFKALHVSYAELLNEEARSDGDKKWYQPRLMKITTFIANVMKWISAIENPSLAEVASSHKQEEEPPLEYAEYAYADVDNADAQSALSNWSDASSVSLRISTEAELVALMAKAST